MVGRGARGIAGAACWAALLAFAAPAVAATGCEELRVARNAIYKDAGYCFRTARAIRAFGNGGCRYDDERDVPLSARQRAEVEDLRRTERAMGCPR